MIGYPTLDGLANGCIDSEVAKETDLFYGCLSGVGNILSGARGTPAMIFSKLCPLNVLPVISLLSPLTGGPGQACPLSLLQSPEPTLAPAPGL